MSTATVLRSRYPRATARVNHYGGGAIRGINKAGHLTRFSVTSAWSTGWALRRYRRAVGQKMLQQIGHSAFVSLFKMCQRPSIRARMTRWISEVPE